jgi:hypothetical protein
MKAVYHVGQVLSVNAAAFWVFMSNANILLTFLSVAAALSFTVYKFYKDYKRNNP